MIVPGKAIGSIGIGQDLDSFRSLEEVETPIEGGYRTWLVKGEAVKGKLNVSFNTQKGEERLVKRIETKDTAFRTIEGVGVGEQLMDIARAFVVRPIDTFTRNRIHYTTFGTQRGVVFVINDKGYCESLIVSPVQEGEKEVYKPFY